jgi:hypothetical protein
LNPVEKAELPFVMEVRGKPLKESAKRHFGGELDNSNFGVKFSARKTL